MKLIFFAAIVAGFFFIHPADAQISFSGGTYSQNFNTLVTVSAPWTNNVTLPGWYASKANADATNLLAGTGSGTTGGIYSFGISGVNPLTDRALGSVAGSSTTYAYGLRFTNDTGLTITNLTVTFTGEQWRNGGGISTNTLAFSYGSSGSPITDSYAAATWNNFPALNFNSPIVTAGASALDGNSPANRMVFANTPLAGLTVPPGYEFFLRWSDVDDTGSDHGLALDDLTVSFQTTSNAVIVTNPPAAIFTNSSITLLTYNVKGNGTTNWSTNAPQVQAIGRQLMFLKPDVITFNEIPFTNTYQMGNWVTAFLPGYFLATNSGTDGSIRSVIMSRFPLNRAQKWLDGADLKPFGYTNTNSAAADNFTRDLFEAEIAVPNWPLPLHVFTTHLKSTAGTTYADAAAKRAAEAAAITNFFATNYFVLYPTHPFTLSGDMNDGNTNTLAIQRLLSAPMTLRLTNPTNPFSGSINTYSIQGSVSERIDFIFPCDQLRSNITASQVFRTDLLTNFSSNLFSNDDKIASDHLPVLMTFANPFNTPFKFLSIARTNQSLTMKWESQKNRTFNLEGSSNLISWMPFATNLYSATTNTPFTFTTNNFSEPPKFFRIYRVP